MTDLSKIRLTGRVFGVNLEPIIEPSTKIFVDDKPSNILQFKSITATGNSVQVIESDNEIIISGDTTTVSSQMPEPTSIGEMLYGDIDEIQYSYGDYVMDENFENWVSASPTDYPVGWVVNVGDGSYMEKTATNQAKFVLGNNEVLNLILMKTQIAETYGQLEIEVSVVANSLMTLILFSDYDVMSSENQIESINISSGDDGIKKYIVNVSSTKPLKALFLNVNGRSEVNYLDYIKIRKFNGIVSGAPMYTAVATDEQSVDLTVGRGSSVNSVDDLQDVSFFDRDTNPIPFPSIDGYLVLLLPEYLTIDEFYSTTEASSYTSKFDLNTENSYVPRMVYRKNISINNIVYKLYLCTHKISIVWSNWNTFDYQRLYLIYNTTTEYIKWRMLKRGDKYSILRSNKSNKPYWGSVPPYKIINVPIYQGGVINNEIYYFADIEMGENAIYKINYDKPLNLRGSLVVNLTGSDVDTISNKNIYEMIGKTATITVKNSSSSLLPANIYHSYNQRLDIKWVDGENFKGFIPENTIVRFTVMCVSVNPLIIIVSFFSLVKKTE